MGHAELWVQTVGHRSSAFRCERCGSFWSRSTARRGGFSWALINERLAFDPLAGVTVPPRTGSPLLRMLPRRVSATT